MPPPPEEDGPDASSIKPVSSLRARFENMSKPAADTPPPSSSSPVPPPVSRQPSPGPRAEPPKLRRPPSPSPLPERTASTASSAPPPPPPPPPPLKPKPRTPALASTATGTSPSPAPSSSSPSVAPAAGTVSRAGAPPPLSPRPTRPTPSLLVEPPHSPPKGRGGNLPPSAADHSGFFLNPDPVAKLPAPAPPPKPASPSPSSSPRMPKAPSRPNSPTAVPALDMRRSPRLPPSQPPSPPPPRQRSAELRRGRASPDKTKTDKSKPFDKPRPKIPSQNASGHPISPTRTGRDKRSPFSSPPSSSESLDDEPQPPMLPARPRPVSYQPSTHLHYAEHLNRDLRDRDDIHLGRHKAANGDPSLRPPLPTRPATNSPSSLAPRPNAAQKQIPAAASSQFMPPPRSVPPSRVPASGKSFAENGHSHIHGYTHAHASSLITSGHSAAGLSSSSMPPPPSPATKRVVSNPNATTTAPATSSLYQNSMQFPPPPTRVQHGRSMTVDRASARPQIGAQPAASSSFAYAPTSNVVNPGAAAAAAAAAVASPAIEASSSSFASRQATDASAATQAASASASASAPTVVMPFPDATNINRRPPYAKHTQAEINTRYESRQMDVCGQRVATAGSLTRVWSLADGEQLMSLSHGDNIKATCVAFKPATHPDSEGTRVWIGNTAGELMEADIATQSIVYQRTAAHGRHEVVKILRHYDELWTFDDGGSLFVWGPAQDTMGGLVEAGIPTLAAAQHQSYRLPRGHTFSIVVGDELWYATGKELRVFLPTMDGKAQFQVHMRALVQEGTGEITAGTLLFSDPDKVFFGHSDGKVSIYARSDYSCVGVVSLGSYKVSTLTSVGSCIWAGYNTGRVCVYDTTTTPWVVKKDWQAHDQPVLRILADRSSAYHSDQPGQVVSLGADNLVRIWDGLVQDDWLESSMQLRQHTKTSYCRFETITAHVMTWNAGASTPNSLRYADDDAMFMQNMLRESGSPDIFIFGFQELVDLEDKTATAKRFLKSKKKNNDGGADPDRMAHQYRDWRDFLVRCLDDYMEGELYHLLQTSHMVGLFTCIFVKSDLRARVRNVGTTEVKRGMGGLHGNKGAIVIRFLIDDTSLCFVNCHLAAGQSQAASRHNDAAGILDSTGLPIERDANTRIDTYTGGGDGSMILDHELCIWNGDLNYRIDTMSRDAVVGAVKAGNLAKLLDRDQLLVARRRNAGFRLRAFEELPIRFAPTYKYDVGTDNYDSSEKKRSPAWCDRLLYRAGGGPDSITRHGPRIQQLDYQRHEVRVSDHRPVTGRFQLTVKQVDAKKRAQAWMECQQGFEDYRDKVAADESLYYLTQVLGYDTKASQDLLNERAQARRHA